MDNTYSRKSSKNSHGHQVRGEGGDASRGGTGGQRLEGRRREDGGGTGVDRMDGGKGRRRERRRPAAGRVALRTWAQEGGAAAVRSIDPSCSCLVLVQVGLAVC